MSFSEFYARRTPAISFEFFPPKQESNLSVVEETIRDSVELSPDFITITYGAGGGTRELTRKLVSFVNNQIPLPAAAHLTCVGHSVADIDAILDELASVGISRIVALRGDPPKGATTFEPHPQGFANAMQLTEHIHRRGGFSVAVAGYPETHQEAQSSAADIEYLKRKVDAGAEAVLTQLFFDEELYFRFRDRAVAAGITVPIVPGIMPISNVAQIKRFTSMCGATIPERLLTTLVDFESDELAVQAFGVEEAVRMCSRLLAEGARGLHIYTLNKSTQIRPIIMNLRACAALAIPTEAVERESR